MAGIGKQYWIIILVGKLLGRVQLGDLGMNRKLISSMHHSLHDTAGYAP
jgi:hypothetical protein